MKRLQYAFTASALAVCQLSNAQQAPVPSPAPVAPATVSASDGAAAAKTSERASAPAASDGEPAVNQPRIIRGNDMVLGAPKAAPRLDGPPVSLNFEEAPVAQVVRTVLGDILKVDYVLHPPLTGTVTLATRSPVTPDQAAFLLESALQANGLGMVRDARGSYHVGRPDALRAIGGSVRQVGAGPLAPGQGAIVVQLQYIGAAEMAAILRPMMPAESLVRVDNLRNLLVLTGTRTQAEGWLDMISTFDVDLLKGMSVGVFPLKYASIKEVEAALALVSGGSPGASQGQGAPTGATSAARPGSATASTPAAGASALGEANPLFGALRIMPIERLNSILVVTPRASYLEEARRWIEKLDQPSDNGAEAQLHIYKVQNGNARHLASVLSGIFGGAASPSTTSANTGIAPGLSSVTGNSFGQTVPNAFGNTGSLAGGGMQGNRGGLSLGGGGTTGSLGRTNQGGSGFGTQQQGTPAAGQAVATIGNIRVMADELNNSILVWGTKSEYSKIEATLKRLDLPPTQVLIEATIVEVTLTDDLEYGLQWAFNDMHSLNGRNYSGTGVLGNSDTGTYKNPGSGFSYTLSNGNVRATLHALASKSLVKVISSPSLMVLDNHTASITVGNQQPITSSITTPNTDVTSNTTTSSIQYKDTGVGLSVTPSVNSGNLVTMQIDQTVTDVGAQIPEANNQRAFLQRQISSKVAVRSGDAIVLGGLIKDNSSNGKSGVPLLQDVPLLGKLFSTNTANGGRTELLVVITPRVVRTDIDIREVSEDLRDRLKGLKGIDNLGLGTKATPLQSVPQSTNTSN
ncbi:type II secretion system secretin GspD [Acidovorax sp. LjRoot129]|uniref:type II secretion system secretin GspD n=1 Tax=Acidovorax sp. LjRoot129 TaxID=3342260 RepID=UPI003ECDCF80